MRNFMLLMIVMRRALQSSVPFDREKDLSFLGTFPKETTYFLYKSLHCGVKRVTKVETS